MDLWDSYRKISVIGLGSAPILLNTGERHTASLNAVNDLGYELKINNAISFNYSEEHRYIIARDITYDMLLTAYDVNTRSLFAARLTVAPGKKMWEKITSKLGSINRSNFEFRAIGLQNGSDGLLHSVDELHKIAKGRFMEFDLFGLNARHIVIDTKTGVPYNLLLLNRLYRAGELACTVKKEEFANLSEVTLV